MSESDHNPFAAPQTETLAESPAGHVNFEALRTTGNGLRLIYFSLLLLVLLVLAVVGGTFFATKAAGPGPSGLGFLFVFGIVGLLIAALSLIGGLMCVTVPQQSGGKWLVIASVVIQALSQLMVLAGTLLGLNLEVIAMIPLSGLSLILFLLFLGRLSEFIDRDDLRRRAKRMLILLAVYVVVVITTGMSSMAGALDFATVGIALIGGLGALILFVMFANLVNDLSTAIRHPESAAADSRGYV